ncbi:hypothetical protein BaRGS_00004547 [Batillaria attramentaria]|uniref:Uncharacterized protein n=1 Tax=Batillaria attramentaria TaxID=370345 RepID=A0ABD0LZ06_9CAEN
MKWEIYIYTPRESKLNNETIALRPYLTRWGQRPCYITDNTVVFVTQWNGCDVTVRAGLTVGAHYLFPARRTGQKKPLTCRVSRYSPTFMSAIASCPRGDCADAVCVTSLENQLARSWGKIKHF